MTAAPSPAAAELPFPPADLPAFLQCCAGEWMSLRSRFELEASGDDDAWHASERGELVVEALPAGAEAELGGLAAQPKQGGTRQQLHFHADGRFRRSPAASDAAEGRWTLWPDGSLELVIEQGDRELRERIWFTKPNLRLRSTVEQRRDGNPGRASFSSEIRRVSRPAAPAS
jgi:hypothetical protein